MSIQPQLLRIKAQSSLGTGEESMRWPGSVFLSSPPAVQLWPQNCTFHSAKLTCPTLWLDDHLVDMLSEVSPFLHHRGSLKNDFVQPIEDSPPVNPECVCVCVCIHLSASVGMFYAL